MQTKLWIAVILMSVLTAGTVYSQKQNSQERLKDKQTKTTVDTRIDNMGYWREKAAEGLVPVAQPIPVAPAKYTGSMISAKSVMGGKEDSPDVPVTDATNVTESENSIFVDPSDNEHILNSNNSTSYIGGGAGSLYGANYFYSSDGGLNWGGSSSGAGGGNSGDPTTAIKLDGSKMYINYISNPGGMGIAYSSDDGTSWTPKTVAPNPGQLADKNHMWIDNSSTSPYEGNLYIAWTAFGGSNNNNIVISRSSDEGVTWTSPMNLSSAVNAGSHNQGVNIQTGPNGEVYVLWTIYDGWPSDETALGFAKSTDGGATFGPSTRIIEDIRGIRTSEVGKSMRVNSFPVMAVDISTGPNSGNIYAVWTNIGEPGVNSGTDASVYMIRSEDEGAAWSTPVKINQDAFGEGKKHYLPWITCDPTNGILSAVWYDDRNVGGNQCEVFCGNSFDAGETWEDFKVSDVSFTISPIPGLAGDYMGDYLGITAYGSMVYPVWTDTRGGLFMAYTSPYVTNNLPKPTDLSIMLDEETGDITLDWLFEPAEDFLYFNVYRDGELLGTTTDLTYSDMLPDYGIFSYSVTAMHDDGESVAAAGSVQWGNAQIDVNPGVINAVLAPGESTIKTFVIENVGELELEWSINTEITSNKGSKAYCSASGGGDEYISGVMIGDIDNSSGEDGYADYTSMSTIVNMSETYEITIENGNVYSSDDLGIWVDWNQDDDFEDAGENVVCEGGNGGEGTFSITVPDDALPGDTRMRIRIKWSGEDCGDPCGATTYGEVEDYTLSVLGWLMLDPTSGVIASGESTTINVNLDAADLTEGTYTANLNIISNDPDNGIFTVPLTLLVGENILMVTPSADPSEVCPGESSQLMSNVEGGTGTYTYSWTSDPAGFSSSDADPVVNPTEATIYMLEVSDGSNTTNGQVEVAVSPLPEMPAAPTGETELCQDGDNTTYTTTGTPTAISYSWMIEPENAGTIAGTEMEGVVDWDPTFVGLASVTVAGVNECGEGVSSETLEVTIIGFPESPAAPTGETELCQDGDNTSYATTGSTAATSYSWMIDPANAGSITGTGLEAVVDWNELYAGTATISVSGISDCGEGEYSESLEVMVYEYPNVTLEDYPSVYLDTPSFELTGGSPAGGTYSGPGVENGIFDPESAEIGVHTITYVFEENGCESYDEASIEVLEASAINEYVNGLSLEIFPNPNNGEFMVKLNALKNSTINLKVLNNLGVEVLSVKDVNVTNTWERNLNLSDLSGGIYFINIYNDETSILKKMILRK